MGDAADLDDTVRRVRPHVVRHADDLAVRLVDDDLTHPTALDHRFGPDVESLDAGEIGLREIEQQRVDRHATEPVPEGLQMLRAIIGLDAHGAAFERHGFRRRLAENGVGEHQPRRERHRDAEHDPGIEPRTDRDERVFLEAEREAEKRKARREYGEHSPAIPRQFHLRLSA